ncbi:MAG: hypothetical protein PW788_01990 [Micavibrio sp.]|nr:hypothetical protein [Micavibrio sp.]
MINAQGYNAFKAQGDDRTAGMPVASTAASAKTAGANSGQFAQLVQQASGTAETEPSMKITVPAPVQAARNYDDRTAGLAKENAESEATPDADSGSDKKTTFWDFLVGVFDTINPLEHLPVVSTIYAKLTGHKMSPMARIAGDTLYGGPIGTAVGVTSAIVEKKTGKDLGENMLAMLTPKSKAATPAASSADDVQVAVAQLPRANIAWNDTGAGTKNSAEYAQVATDNIIRSLSKDVTVHEPAAGSVIAKASSTASGNGISSLSPQEQNVHVALANRTAADPSRGYTGRKNIVFKDFASTQTPHLKPLHLASMQKQPASLTAPNPGPVLQSGGATPAAKTATSPAMTPVATTADGATPATPASQEAPVALPQNQVVPPELIAQKMMMGLDKYAALKTGNMAYNRALAN